MNLRKCVIRGLMSAVMIYLGQNFCVGFREWETPSQETIRAQTNEKNLRRHRTEDGTGAPRQDARPPLEIRVIKEPEPVTEAAGQRIWVCRKMRANSSPELKVTAGGKKATDEELKPTERSGWSAGSLQWLVLSFLSSLETKMSSPRWAHGSGHKYRA